MPSSVNTIIRTAARIVDLVYGAVPHAGVKTAAHGASIILAALADVMDTHGMTTEDMVRQIKQIPDWQTLEADRAIDQVISELPPRPDGYDREDD